MKPTDAPSMRIRCNGRRSAVGPPRIRRSSKAGSRRSRSSVMTAERAKNSDKYTQACQYLIVPAAMNRSRPSTVISAARLSHALTLSVAMQAGV